MASLGPRCRGSRHRRSRLATGVPVVSICHDLPPSGTALGRSALPLTPSPLPQGERGARLPCCPRSCSFPPTQGGCTVELISRKRSWSRGDLTQEETTFELAI